MKCKLVLLLLLISSSYSYAQRLSVSVVKIGIFQNQSSFNIGCEGVYYIHEISSERKQDIKASDIYLVKGEGKEIRFNGFTFTSPIKIIPKDPKNRVSINGKHYRDTLLITCKDSRLSFINELGLDDYIYGILPREVSPDWPIETLKAQAVISRTYALQNIGKHDKDNFDLCTSVHCQVYGSADSEDKRSNKAVDETKGEVITYNDKMANVFFHASCGGHTEDPQEVWNYGSEPPKYLMGHICKFCKDSPYSNWKNAISSEYIRKKLLGAGYDVGEIKKISRSSKTRAGKAKIIKIKGSKVTVTFNAAKFRLLVEPNLIRSTLIYDISKKGSKFVFTGSGWGHAIGMCQEGAKKMGEKGYDYKQILEYYFHKTDVQRWE